MPFTECSALWASAKPAGISSRLLGAKRVTYSTSSCSSSCRRGWVAEPFFSDASRATHDTVMVCAKSEHARALEYLFTVLDPICCGEWAKHDGVWHQHLWVQP